MLTSNQTQKLNLSSAQIMTTFGVPDELKFIGIRITDNGSGMTPEIAEKTKEPFITSKPPGTGKGIGLNMVDRFVTESQGHISIETELGTGTTVSLFVPQISAEKLGKRIDKTESDQTQTKKTNILVVEESPRLRALVCRMLRSQAYEVLTAEDGESAINIASNDS